MSKGSWSGMTIQSTYHKVETFFQCGRRFLDIRGEILISLLSSPISDGSVNVSAHAGKRDQVVCVIKYIAPCLFLQVIVGNVLIVHCSQYFPLVQ